MLERLLKKQEGGVRGAIWAIGSVIVIVAIVLLLYFIAPDLVGQVLIILVNYVLNSFGI